MFLCLALLLGGAPSVEAAPRVQDDGAATDGDAWRDLLVRDRRLGFPASNPEVLQALAVDAEPVDALHRQAALVALGASREPDARRLLTSWTSEGTGPDRLAAILGLGQLGTRLGQADLLLVDALLDEGAQVRECALLALLQSGPGWRTLANGIAADAEHPLHADAPILIAFLDDPTGTRQEHRAIRLLLDLRWSAARWFGTIDGQGWGSTLLDQLGENQRFLDEVVLHSATRVHLAGVKDHLVELLLQPGSPVRVRVAVRVLPRELDEMVHAGLWAPENTREWRALIDEAYRAGVVPLLPHAMELATRHRAVAPAAAATLVRRDGRHEEALYAALDGDDPSLKVLACRGIGENALDRFARRLESLVDDEDLSVRGAALAARLQLGDLRARDIARTILLDHEQYGREERGHLRDALAATGRSGDVTAILHDLALELEGADRADLLAISALRGRLVPGEELRALYPLCAPGSTTARRVIEALSTLPTAEDLEFLAKQFPVDGDVELNIALARALIRGGHKKVEPVLRKAVWKGPLDRSVLAAAVVKQTSGMRTLVHWVLKPPSDATSADVRRVGYAIGEWGGVSAIRELQERMGGVAGADRPALQGAYLGAMASRTH